LILRRKDTFTFRHIHCSVADHFHTPLHRLFTYSCKSRGKSHTSFKCCGRSN